MKISWSRIYNHKSIKTTVSSESVRKSTMDVTMRDTLRMVLCMEEESIIRDSCVVGEIGSGCFCKGCEGFLKNRDEVRFCMTTGFQSRSKLLDYTSVIINIGILIPIMMDISKNNAFEHSRRMGRSWRDVEEQVCWFLLCFRDNMPILNFQSQVKKTSF
jgi:hypothetical protein